MYMVLRNCYEIEGDDVMEAISQYMETVFESEKKDPNMFCYNFSSSICLVEFKSYPHGSKCLSYRSSA